MQEEKVGGRLVTTKSNFFLRNFMFEVGALDIGYRGKPFTWCNKRSRNANICEHLNRILVCLEWRSKFDKAGVIHLSRAYLDHVPI